MPSAATARRRYRLVHAADVSTASRATTPSVRRWPRIILSSATRAPSSAAGVLLAAATARPPDVHGANTVRTPNQTGRLTSICRDEEDLRPDRSEDRKSTRLNSSHLVISYA